MKRNIETVFEDWKEAGKRKVLLVRGARQVGKTYSVNWKETSENACLSSMNC